jgi:hypothetical protein
LAAGGAVQQLQPPIAALKEGGVTLSEPAAEPLGAVQLALHDQSFQFDSYTCIHLPAVFAISSLAKP